MGASDVALWVWILVGVGGLYLVLMVVALVCVCRRKSMCSCCCGENGDGDGDGGKKGKGKGLGDDNDEEAVLGIAPPEPFGERKVDNPMFGQRLSAISLVSNISAQSEMVDVEVKEAACHAISRGDSRAASPAPLASNGGDGESGKALLEDGSKTSKSAHSKDSGVAKSTSDLTHESGAATAAIAAKPEVGAGTTPTQPQQQQQPAQSDDRAARLAAMRAARNRKKKDEWAELEETLAIIDQLYYDVCEA
eukprot:m.12780 g.12780  ORF g.12780 m.12780 type:complete len:250 (-) comp5863_c0_seq1:339-1088(-)